MSASSESTAGRRLPPISGYGGAVAAPHHLATSAGLAALAAGGNAIDAAVAASCALAVVYPHMAGVGGDLFALVRSGPDGSVVCLNAGGKSAAAASVGWYRGRGHAAIPTRGPLAALTVPGAVSGWSELVRRHGRLDLAAALRPAAALARGGFPVSSSLARWLERDHAALREHAGPSFLVVHGGGARVTIPRLADTLDAIAAGGEHSFYRGPVGDEIARALERSGSPLARSDFAEHAAEWQEPVSAEYRGWRISTAPPNSQGFILLEILGLLGGRAGERSRYDLTPSYVLDLVAATRTAFVDRDRLLGDPRFTGAQARELLDGARLERLRRDGARAWGAGRALDGDTICVCAGDREGNLVSLIQSLYFDFGSAHVAGETGVLLQNRGVSFTLDAGPRQLAPGKRPAHTLMPVVGVREGAASFALGTMGGDGQPQTTAAVCTRLIDEGLEPQDALDAPRWLYGRTWGETTQTLSVETAFPEDTLAALAAAEPALRRVAPWSEPLGHAQLVLRRETDGLLTGAADPRGDGSAAAR